MNLSHIQSLTCSAAASILAGSLLLATLTGCKSTPAAAAKPAVDWKGDFLKEKDLAEGNVRLARTVFPENSRNRLEAESRYVRARTALNLQIDDIQESIRAGRKPDQSPLYATRAQAAQEALLRFNNFVQQNGLPPEKQPKVWPVLLPVVTQLGSLVWEKISSALGQRSESRKAILDREAASLDSVRFVSFSEVSSKS